METTLFEVGNIPSVKNPMARKYGKGPDGAKCKTCCHLYNRKGWSKTYYKCELRGDTHGPGTDHRVNYEACAKYE